jgi:endonuclease YncB( thermonuclease family)
MVLLMTTLLFSNYTYADYQWSSPRVVDGDTVEFRVDWLPKELGDKIKIRVYGVDTPEKAPRAKCEKEAEMAIKASNFSKSTIASAKNIRVVVKGWDKYGGRLLGDVIVDNQSLKDLLIKNKLAREYHGEEKQSWCN